MLIEALQSNGDLVRRLQQFRGGTETVADILLNPMDISQSADKIKNTSKNINDAIQYLEDVKKHFDKYFDSSPSVSE